MPLGSIWEFFPLRDPNSADGTGEVLRLIRRWGNPRPSRPRPGTKPRPKPPRDTPPKDPAPRCSTFSTPLSDGPTPFALSHPKTGSFTGFPSQAPPFPPVPPLPCCQCFRSRGFSEGAVFLGRWFGPWGSPRGRPQRALAARRPPRAHPSELEQRSSLACGSRPS